MGRVLVSTQTTIHCLRKSLSLLISYWVWLHFPAFLFSSVCVFAACGKCLCVLIYVSPVRHPVVICVKRKKSPYDFGVIA